jgi:hypothetical protein
MASTIRADMILNGKDPFEDIDIPDIAGEILASFAHSSPLNAVSDEVTLDDWTGKMKSWKETTSTSPSGMHLGHHKTLIKQFHPDNPPANTPPELLELESQRLQHRNQVHFGQAHGTFPTTPQFTDHIDWMASTITAIPLKTLTFRT